jgi:hypothetical protein
MKTILLAAATVLTLAFGTAVLAAPDSASKTYLHGANQNEGANN